MKVLYWEDKNELNKIKWIKKYNNACIDFQKNPLMKYHICVLIFLLRSMKNLSEKLHQN